MLDPFAGCATTCIAAERLGRRWIGIDLWSDAYQITLDRLKSENLAVSDDDSSSRLTFGDIHLETEPPVRTDQLDAKPVPVLETPTGRQSKQTRLSGLMKSELKQTLLADNPGLECSGCDYRMPTAEHLTLDHMWPSSAGGGNELINLCLLCHPCNSRKSNTLTLPQLRSRNRTLNLMADQNTNQQVLV